MGKKKPTFKQLEGEYADMWKDLTVRPHWQARMNRRADKIIANKGRYLQIENEIGVPWYWIGVVHSMEAGLGFRKHLHNGDSLRRRTYRVPSGRPTQGKPPFTWEESAADALLMKRLDRVETWSPARCCYELENYNGWGYALYHPRTKSPYLWSGTTYYRRGKYVADGKWSSRAVSQQTGAAALLRVMADKDASITFGAKPPKPEKKPPQEIPVAKPLP